MPERSASDRALRETHIGCVLQWEGDGITFFRDDTLATHDKGFFLEVRDVLERPSYYFNPAP